MWPCSAVMARNGERWALGTLRTATGALIAPTVALGAFASGPNEKGKITGQPLSQNDSGELGIQENSSGWGFCMLVGSS